MKRRLLALAITASIALPFTAAKAAPPTPEPRVLPGVGQVTPGGACDAESAFEVGSGTRYDGAAPYDQCQRLKVVFGPIWAKPGQNDVLIQPVTFEKPMYPGYLVRFKPDLVGADGLSPKVQDVHLHHGTWFNPSFLTGDPTSGVPKTEYTDDPARNYGWGPWIASGEEKTIAVWPKGYGLKILPSDQWFFLHMIHNATPQTFPVWVTYELDFIPAAAAEAVNPDTGKPFIHNTKGVWLDVGDCSWAPTCKKDSFNPIFNIQRGYGAGGTCVFPLENCAQQNTMAGTSAQQGVPGTYYDETEIREDGTLTMMGGHLHFGGLNDKVYLVRDLDGDGCAGGTVCKTTGDHEVVAGHETASEVKLIHISDAFYFDKQKPASFDPFDINNSVVGGEPSSWDMVMTGVTKDLGWSIRVHPGDKLRIEGEYDSTFASWYEQMGIVMTWLAPGDTSGMNPFDPAVSIEQGLNSLAPTPPTTSSYALPGSNLPACTPNATTICVRGQATHGRIATSSDHMSCELNGCPNIARSALDGPLVTDIQMGGFTYGIADMSIIPLLGVPTVKVDKPVTFWNADTADYMWHTVTRCANPCSGTTSASYPIPDGAYDDVVGTPPATITDPIAKGVWVQDQIRTYVNANGPDSMDFDSGQIGIGTGANNKVSWTWTPSRTGTFTFFCRIHPGMRGAIRVVA